MRKLGRWFIFGIALCALITLLMPGRNQLPPAGAGLKDALGRNITIPVNKPVRIVSLAPANTEILFAIGAGDQVVGVTSYCNFPEEAKQRPKVGGFYNPDIETIVMMHPDIVFSTGEMQRKTVQALEKAGINVVAVEPQNMQQVLQAINLMGLLVHEQDKSSKLSAELEQKFAAVQAKVNPDGKRRVFLEVWDVPLLTVGAKSYINDVVVQAGGVNVAGDRQADYLPSDYEMLYAYNPDTYLVIRNGEAGKESRVFEQYALADIDAVKANRIFYVNDDYLGRSGPRSFTALEQIADILQSK